MAKSGTAFHYDLDGTLIAESTATGEPLRETIWLGHLPVAMITFDHDGDGVRDPIDNCILDDNPTRLDASGEGYGNRCDGDANGDGSLTKADMTLIQQMNIGSIPADPAVINRGDITGNGSLSSLDLAHLNRHMQAGRTAPGPSGVLGQWSGPELLFIQADHLGTPRVILDQQNRVNWRWDHADPFGASAVDESFSQNGASPPVQRLRSNLRFPGQYYDVETGLHYNYYRDYEPQTGRYVQSDPIGLRGGINTYAYVGGNPTSFLDSHGLVLISPFSAEDIALGGGGGGGAGFSGGTIGRPVAPAIKPGSAGGPTAGQRFPQGVIDAAKAENPGAICVYCRRPAAAPQVDHAIARARGGNATIDNAQLACPHCNPSKGARNCPVNPPPDYVGPWPPPWWEQ